MFSIPASLSYPDRPMRRKMFIGMFAEASDRSAHRGGEYTGKQLAKTLGKIAGKLQETDQTRSMLAAAGVDVPLTTILHSLADLAPGDGQFEQYAALLAASCAIALSVRDLVVEVRIRVKRLNQGEGLGLIQGQLDRVVGLTEGRAQTHVVGLVIHGGRLPREPSCVP